VTAYAGAVTSGIAVVSLAGAGAYSYTSDNLAPTVIATVVSYSPPLLLGPPVMASAALVMASQSRAAGAPVPIGAGVASLVLTGVSVPYGAAMLIAYGIEAAGGQGVSAEFATYTTAGLYVGAAALGWVQVTESRQGLAAANPPQSRRGLWLAPVVVEGGGGLGLGGRL